MTDLLTEAQVAALLHKGPATVRRLRRQGKLPFLPGRPVLIPATAVDRYIASAIVTTEQPRRRRPRVRLLKH